MQIKKNSINFYLLYFLTNLKNFFLSATASVEETQKLQKDITNQKFLLSDKKLY